ncbi:cellulase family glycosylhydrolase [Candidatus Chlorohelix sp.]|uniref:cellulase family glycosylhydrolase n=1 Tax=Candidatus Chlorohelix sp. TaxID=3139201 RepID=UPI003052C4DC
MKSGYNNPRRGPQKNKPKNKYMLAFFSLVALVVILVLWNFSSAPTLRPYPVEAAYLPEPTYGPVRYEIAPVTPQARTQNPVQAQADPNQNPIIKPTQNSQQNYLPPLPTYGAPPTIAAGVPINPIPTVPGSSNTSDSTAYPVIFDKPVYNQPVAPISVKNGQLVDGIGARFFLAGVNYEGATDRAWVMWNNDRFDPALIQKDLAAATAGGYNTVRIFVQTQLRDDILKGDFSKLDKVLELARSNNLFILLTFADYDEMDLRKLSKVNALVAERYVNQPYMLGYDLKNEPNFVHIAGAIYPDSVQPPFQTDLLIKTYGERMNQAAADAYRRTSAGWHTVGSVLDSRLGYYVVNASVLYEEYLSDASDWALKNGATTLDYMSSPEAQGKWKVFIDAANGTLQAWYDSLLNPIRQFDKNKPVTTGFNNAFWARLPAGDSMSFVSIHRYAPSGTDGLKTTFAVMDALKRAFPGRPVCLEEFGYSNSDYSGRSTSSLTTAAHETALWLYLYGKGFAGGYKWMLRNFSIGANVYENNFGLYDDSNNPKPTFFAARAILRMTDANRAPSGDFNTLEDSSGGNINYFWTSGNSFFGNSASFKNSRVQLDQKERAPWAIWWPSNGLGQVHVIASSPARVTLDLRAFFPSWNPKLAPVLQVEDGQAPSVDRTAAGLLSFNASAGTVYTISLPVPPATFARTESLGGSNSLYFKETGHNLSNAFKRFWEQRNGSTLLGMPISEEFQEGGLTVQYFERARLEYHPEYSGTSAEVQLGLLGRLVSAGRRESDAPFKTSAAFPNSADRIYFKETGHSLSTGFKVFWEKYGGLTQFGYPISEEFTEINPVDGKTYNVQYFERGRLEYHPEAKGTPFEIQVGLLGMQVLKARGWIQ